MRRSWLVISAWCVGFVWAVVLIMHAMRAEGPVPVPQPQLPPPSATIENAAWTRGPVPTEVAESHYVGNVKTHKLHRKTCRYSGCMNCTARFKTREDAIAAGYDPCGTCEP